MLKKIIKNSLIILLVFVLGLLVIENNITISAETIESSEWYDSGEFRETAYSKTLARWLNTYQKIQTEYQEYKVENDEIMLLNNTLSFPSTEIGIVVNIPRNEKFKMIINVNNTGLYNLGMSYRINEEFSSSPFINLQINGKDPFNEATELPLEVTWQLEERNEEDKYNRYGNELLPNSNPIDKWYNNYFDDTNSRYIEPYYFLLEKGENIIEITSLSYEILVYSFMINDFKELTDYDDYITSLGEVKIIDTLNTIQAEKFSYKNDIEIKASYYKDPAMTPSAYKNTCLNMVDGSSSSRGGLKYTYSFTVKETGLYAISLKYLQNTLKGVSSMKNIYINGIIPFKEFIGFSFPQNNRWKNITLSDSQGNPYYIYFEKDIENTISFETSNYYYNDLIEELYSVMDSINGLGLTISSITGSSKNQYNDWDILKYLPNLITDLNNFADRIDSVYNQINEMNPEFKEASEVSSLRNASKLLRKLCERPNRIHLKLAQLNSGSGSAYQLVGNAIGILLTQPVSFDALYLGGEETLPKANANIFRRFWFGLKSFIYSFFDDRYKVAANNDDEILEVWVAQSSLYLDIIQGMVDDKYTKQTGQEVKVSILPSSQKIVLNNATGTNPDLVLSIDSWEPYNYALRGMLHDLKQFDDFDEVTSNIYANCFTPLICNDGVYGIPETQGMYIMFYRKDILNYLDLEAPDTWDDVLKMLPILQSYQMNFYHPLGSDSTYKNFSATTQFIYSFGGEVFSQNGVQTVINTEEDIKAIQYMTDLFNVYNLPLQVSNFFEHFRSGTLPIGISTIDMYLQLKYASPELTGQWGILPIPGFDENNDNEVERWATAYGKCSIMFESSTHKDKAWDFLKWWHSTETQIEYLQNIKMRLGEKYLIIPANVEALNQSPWDMEIKNEVAKAAKWSRIPAVIPGSYVVEREISTIWNKIVIDRTDVRIAVSQSIDKINRELARKFEEFGYVKKGSIESTYVVPNNSNISRWVKGKQYE